MPPAQDQHAAGRQRILRQSIGHRNVLAQLAQALLRLSRARRDFGNLNCRPFALGADALTLARCVARGESKKSILGFTGTLTYDLAESPIVDRLGKPAVITNGGVKPLTPQQAIAWTGAGAEDGAKPKEP